jgi:hypothetical protein
MARVGTDAGSVSSGAEAERRGEFPYMAGGAPMNRHLAVEAADPR